MAILRRNKEKAHKAADRYEKEGFKLKQHDDGTLSMYVEGDPSQTSTTPPELLNDLNSPFRRRRALETIQAMKERGMAAEERRAATNTSNTPTTTTTTGGSNPTNKQGGGGNGCPAGTAPDGKGNCIKKKADNGGDGNGTGEGVEIDVLQGSEDYSPYIIDLDQIIDIQHPEGAESVPIDFDRVPSTAILEVPGQYASIYDGVRENFKNQQDADDWTASMERLRKSNYDTWRGIMQELKGRDKRNTPTLETDYKFNKGLIESNPRYDILRTPEKERTGFNWWAHAVTDPFVTDKREMRQIEHDQDLFALRNRYKEAKRNELEQKGKNSFTADIIAANNANAMNNNQPLPSNPDDFSWKHFGYNLWNDVWGLQDIAFSPLANLQAYYNRNKE